MTERFCTRLDCVDVGFMSHGLLDQLPLPSQAGATPGRRGRPEQATHPLGHGIGQFHASVVCAEDEQERPKEDECVLADL
jgi:hypothetical protein